MFIIRAICLKASIRINKNKRIFGEFIKYRSKIGVAIMVCEPLLTRDINQDRFIFEIRGDAIDILKIVIDFLKPC